MKKIVLMSLVVIFVISGFGEVIAIDLDNTYLKILTNNSRLNGHTLITELFPGRVIEVDDSGTVVWEKSGLIFPFDAKRLETGNTLITVIMSNRVIEVDNSGAIVWQKSGLNHPMDAERLDNGNTLIVDSGNGRVIEVNAAGTIVWEKTELETPYDVERLENSNTLITECTGGNRVIEVDNSGAIVWQKTGLNWPTDAERLENGNTLISDSSNLRVIEVNAAGTIVWEKTELETPYDAARLDNGNTLITEGAGNRVIEVDNSGTIVWQKTGLNNPTDAERLPTSTSEPPTTPTIEGETHGQAGETYEYTFLSTDPDGDEIFYIIDWGCGETETTDFYPSGEPAIASHVYDVGTYTIRAKATDINGAESDWGNLTITMPADSVFVESQQVHFNHFVRKLLR